MAFFGQNTARNTAQFANDAGEWRKDSEARALQSEIDQVGREVMQALASVKPEEMADAMPKIAQMLKSKNYSERALVAGINLAMGYTKASLSNQQSKAATQASNARTKTSENVNAAYADEQAVKGALADVQQHPTGVPYSLPEDYNKSRLSELTPTQQFSALGAQTATKAAAAETALKKKKTLAEIAKLNADAGAKSTGSIKDQEDAYNRSVQSLMIQVPGLQADAVSGLASGTFKKEEAKALKQLADKEGIALYSEAGEPLDEHTWAFWKADTPTQKITLMPRGKQASQIASTTPTQTTPTTPPMSKTQLDQLINSDSMNLPTMGPQNDPNAVTTQTMPTEGMTQGQVRGAQQGKSLLQSSGPSQQQILDPTPGGAQTLSAVAPVQPSNEVLTDNASSLGALVKNKTSKVDAYKAKAKQYVKGPEEEALLNKVIDKYRAKQKLEPDELKLMDLIVSMLHEAP